VALGGDATVKGTVAIDDRAVIGTIDGDFVCATLDWWPPDKCDYGRCSWGLASLLNLVFLLSFLLFLMADEFLEVCFFFFFWLLSFVNILCLMIFFCYF